MRRLKVLLECYERDSQSRSLNGLSNLSYSSWAKLEAKKTKRTSKTSPTHSSGGEGDESIDLIELPTAYNTGLPVVVTTESLIATKNRRKSYKRKETEEWRLALRARPRVFVPNKEVICLVRCGDMLDARKMRAKDKEFEFFIGTVVKLVDDHVKVHFTGLNRKEDLWYTQDSPHLFLNGGPTEPPVNSEEGSPDKKQQK